MARPSPRPALMPALLPSLALAALVPAGCGELPGDGEPDTLPRLALVEELRIGALDDPPEEVFGSISAVAVPTSGELWILDSQVPTIRRFAPDGTFLGESGGRGEGPGELQQPMGMVAADPDGVAVWDPANARLSFFGGDGEFMEGFPVPSGLFGGSEPLLADTLGRFYVIATDFPEGWTPSPNGGFPMTRVRIERDGTIVDSIPLPASDESAGPNFVLRTPQGSVRPFPVATHSTLDAAGALVYGRSDGYTLLRGSPDGNPDTLIHRTAERLPVAGEELDQFEGWLRYFRETNPDGFSASDRIPDLKPVFQYLTRDQDGRIWVRMHVPGQLVENPVDPADRDPDGPPPLNYREPTLFHIWESDGRPVGEIALPRPGFVLEARGNLVWIRETGELGEPQLVRYRLTAVDEG